MGGWCACLRMHQQTGKIERFDRPLCLRACLLDCLLCVCVCFFLFLVFIFCMTVKILLALWFTISSGRRRSFRAKYKLILHFIRRTRNHKKSTKRRKTTGKDIFFFSSDGLVFLRSFFPEVEVKTQMPVAETQPNATNWCETPSTNIACVILLTIFTTRFCMHFRRKKRVSHHVLSLLGSTSALMESYFRNRARMVFSFGLFPTPITDSTSYNGQIEHRHFESISFYFYSLKPIDQQTPLVRRYRNMNARCTHK